jgi:hypothetical protein
MSEENKCKCGHTIDDDFVTAKSRYNKWGWLLLSLAYSAKPVEIIFQCQKCGEIIEKSTDREVIEKYRYNSDILK